MPSDSEFFPFTKRILEILGPNRLPFRSIYDWKDDEDSVDM